MPANRRVAKEEIAAYAGVLFDAVNERGGLDAVLAVRSQMEAVIAAMREDMDLQRALSDPDATDEQRYEVAKGTFAACEPELAEVLAVMASRKDMQFLPRVYEAFNGLMAEKLDTVVVDVTTVVPLDDELRRIIKEKTEADLGSKVVLNEHIDASILGGIIMSTGEKRIDASIISQLNHARNVLKETTDGGEC